MIINKNNYNIETFTMSKLIIGDKSNPEYSWAGSARDITAARYDHLKQSLKEIKIENGMFLEFGVHKGGTINTIAKAFPTETIYGFDSFEGLPEDWNIGHKVVPKGHFSLDRLPWVEPNVRLYKGWFKDTIKEFLSKGYGNKISFLHVDGDLYSSGIDVLYGLNDFIIKDTIIVFDDFYSWGRKPYSTWQEGEYKALKDWITKFDREFEILYHSAHQQCSIRIVK